MCIAKFVIQSVICCGVAFYKNYHLFIPNSIRVSIKQNFELKICKPYLVDQWNIKIAFISSHRSK